MPQTVGRIVDRSYLLCEKLGEGGMGTVYRAKQLVSGAEAALKLVSEGKLKDPANAKPADPSLRLALAREFQILASLHHPNVIRVLSYGFDDEVGPYFTMELLSSPQNILQAAASQSIEGKVELVAQLLRALAYVHQRGILHRDIKPTNVLVEEGEVKLLDFGIALDSTTISELSGTLEYMAPELLMQQPPSVASDLYSVGVLFYQILSGSFPYSRKSLTRMLSGILGEDSDLTFAPTVAGLLAKYRGLHEEDAVEMGYGSNVRFPDEVPNALSQIVLKLLARRPEERYKDARTSLKELAKVVHIALPVETAATRESFLQATKLVGRDAELKRLLAAFEQAKARHGAGFLVGGQSGIGKSRLISELRTQALVAGSWVAEGQSVSNGGIYYQEWIPLLRELCFRTELTDAEASILKPLIPDIGDLLARQIPDATASKSDEWQTRLAETLVKLLAKSSKPVMILQEDLHWASDETLSLLSYLTARLQNLPILYIGTFRSDESPHLPTLLPSLEVIALQRLASSDIAHLSESILGQAGTDARLLSYLDQQTEGNAFFLIEIVRALAENVGELREIGEGALPETILTFGIERIIERRLEHLSKPLRDMLEFSAILGRKLDLQVLEHAFPELALRTVLIECANLAVLESQGNDWRFAHDKLREALLQKLDFSRRNYLHGNAAVHLEIVYKTEAQEGKSAILAYHFREAGAYEKSLDYYRLAAENAANHNLTFQSRAHYASAQKLFAKLPDTPERRRLSVDLAMKEVAAGLGYIAAQDSLNLLTNARDLLKPLVNTAATAAADRLRMVRLEQFCGRVYQYTGQAREAIISYQQILTMTNNLDDAELKTMSLLRIGLCMCFLGYFGKARELLNEPLQNTIKIYGIHENSMRGILYYCVALAGSGHAQQGLLELEEARKIMQKINRPPTTLAFKGLEFLVYITMADWPVILQTAQQNLKSLAQQTDDPMYTMTYMDGSAWAQSHLGNSQQALENRAQALSMRRASGGGLLPDWYDAAEAEILLNAGRSEEALKQAEKVVASSRESDQRYSQAIAERVWGAALGRLGHGLARAVEHFEASLELSHSAEQVINIAQTELCWGRLLRERGDEPAARLHFHRALEHLSAGGYTYALAQARRIAFTES